jgi:hypothetical protein
MDPGDKELLRDEYLALQKAIEEFDSKALTIKAWSVTASAAGLGLAYSQHQWQILLVATFGSMTFWMIDALWKVNQRVYYPRTREIEDYFAGQNSNLKPFQVSRLRREENIRRPKLRRTFEVMREPVAALPHLPVAVAGLALMVFLPPKADASKQVPCQAAQVQATGAQK